MALKNTGNITFENATKYPTLGWVTQSHKNKETLYVPITYTFCIRSCFGKGTSIKSGEDEPALRPLLS